MRLESDLGRCGRGACSRATWLALAAGFLFAGSLARAEGYVRTIASQTDTSTTCIAWNTRDYVYRVEVNGSARTPGDTEIAAIGAAFASWQTASNRCSDFQFTRGPRIRAPRVGLNTEEDNVIVFREQSCAETVEPEDPCWAAESCGNDRGCWDHSEATIALTTSTYSTRSGIVFDSDIEFNGYYFFTTVVWPPCQYGRESPTCVAYDIQNTATHEIGHVIGLAHVAGDTATMSATAPLGETIKRVIDPGTEAGFCSIYPRGRPPVPCDEASASQLRVSARTVGVAGCSGADVTATGILAPGLIVLAGAFLRSRRRRIH